MPDTHPHEGDSNPGKTGGKDSPEARALDALNKEVYSVPRSRDLDKTIRTVGTTPEAQDVEAYFEPLSMRLIISMVEANEPINGDPNPDNKNGTNDSGTDAERRRALEIENLSRLARSSHPK